MLNAVTDYAEALNQAIDLIVAQRISEIPQDETVICTVVDDSDKENGHYKVAPNDSIIYDAYTDVKTYGIDSRVYVLTPKDGSPRTIVSRYLGDKDSSPVEYVSPKNYLIPQGDEYPIESFDGAVEIDRSFLDRTRLYNALYISAEFKVPLDGVADPEQDYYALKIIGTNSANQSREFSLDSNQMFGDPFNYMGYFKQDQCFKYSITEDFTSLKVFLVTNGKSTGKVQVRNISLQFGFETATAIKDQIELTSYDALSYNPTDTSSLTKKLNLLWYNLDDNKYIGFEDGEFNLIKAQVEPEDEKVYYAIQWYLDNKDGSQELKKSTDTEVDTTFDFTCDATKATQTIKAIMWRNGKRYTDSIEFTNSASVEVTPPEIAGLEIAIKHGEKSLDVYPYYGADNQLIDPAQSYLSREIYFDWSTTSGIVEAEYWKDATLYWYVPKNATMLSVGHLNKLESIPEGDNMIKEGYDGYRVVDASDIEHRSFYYSIGSLYNVAFTNNTILCVAKKGDRTWQAQLTPTFSSIGSSGTDYTIAFSIEGGHPGFVEGIHGESNPLKITAQLYDPDGQKVEGDEYCQTKELAKYPDVIAEQIWTVSMEALWRGQNVKLSASYPIAKLSRADIYASIPTTVVYDNLGTTASYYKGLLALFEKSNNAEVENLTWQVVPEGVKYAPKIVNGALAVPSLYISGIEEIAIEAIQGSAVIWHQPLIITQNRYASQFLNDWDGSLEIDDENNTIMASMLGAGKKEDDNSFTGVLMGDVREKGGTTTTGLYGYHKGAQSFGFNTDGTAFIGKDGKGRIEFNGNDSVIKSPGYIKNNKNEWKLQSNFTTGTMFDLNNAVMLLGSENGNHVFYNQKGTGDLDLKVSSFKMVVGKNDDGSPKYDTPTSTGTVQTMIDVTAGQIVSEVRQYDVYYGTCDTVDGIPDKELSFNQQLPDNWLEIDNFTIAIKFNYAQTVQEEVSEETVEKDGLKIHMKTTIRRGQELYLTIDKGLEGELSLPVFVNEHQTNAEDQIITSDDLIGDGVSFGWDAGSTLYFTLSKDVGWYVTDTVTSRYTQSIQTANGLYNFVSDTQANTMSQVTQLADSITSTVSSISANYAGTYDDVNGHVIVQGNMVIPENKTFQDVLFQPGVSIAVTFDKTITLTDIVFYYNKSKSESCTVKYKNSAPPAFSWESGDTIVFTYQDDNCWHITDSGAYSKIKQTADSITSEVVRRASYYGVCETASAEKTKVVTLINAPNPFTHDQFFIEGRMIAVEFTNAEEASVVDVYDYEKIALTKDTYSKDTYYVKNGDEYVISNVDFIDGEIYYYQVKKKEFQGQMLNLTIDKYTYPIYRDGKITDVSNPFGWSAGSVIYFAYSTSGYWIVSDSGSYSRILQTADSITSTVASMDGQLSSEIKQTQSSITAKITDLEKGLSSQIDANAESITIANKLIGSQDKTIQALASDVDLLSNKSTIYFGRGDYGDDINEWFIDLTTATTGFKSGDIVQINFESDRPTSSSDEKINFQFFYAGDAGEQKQVGEGAFEVHGDYLNWYKDETLAFVYTGNVFLLTYISQSQLETTATNISAKVANVGGYAALIYDYDYIELDPSHAECLFRAEFSPEVQITTLPTGTIIALKCDEALSLEQWEKCQGQISIWFQQDATEFGPFQIKDTPCWAEGNQVYFMLMVDMEGYPYLRPTSPISSAQLDMLSDMMSARVMDGATGNGFGWNLNANGFTLQASVTDANGTTTQTEVLKCDAKGLTITGTINATAGKIGGWEINAYKIFGGKPKVKKNDEAQCCVVQVPGYEYEPGSQTKWVFAAGSETHETYSGAPFRVDRNGSMYASAGYIGGWKITSNSLESSNGKTKFTTSNNGGLTLAGSFVYQGHTIIVESDTGYLRAYT